MNSVLVIARLLLAAVFGVSGVAKVADLRGARKSMGDFGVPASLAMPVAVLLALFELVCAIGLLTSSWAWWSAAAVLGMLVAFILAMAANLARGRSPDCHCFGQLHASVVERSSIRS